MIHKIGGDKMSMAPKMRTIKQAIKEIKESDSKTALTERGLRRLVEEKKIVSTLIGNRNLIDMDQLYDYLSGKNRS
ncbi:MAG: hypothetical protein IJO03_07875 [Clostridia bacterium]|nr:hypothetical protein [Clostridia bacterium]